MQFNKHLSLSILSSLTILFITTGCVPKNADGTYNSRYSYHPYNKHKSQKNIYYGNKIKIPNPSLQRDREYNKYNRNTNYPIHRNKTNPFQEKSFLNKYVKKRKITSRFLPDRIENKAKSLLGVKYKYGASGPYQYDCSGFTKHVFSSQGITLPRTSKEQAKVGKYLRYSELKKGDLIFFKSDNNNKVSHVGIFIGKGKFIHASSSKKKVVISNMNSNYAITHFKWGRRVEENKHFARR
jgi:cell wall-associated NlpC family hydrolase